ncbi:efflux RND transporter permease subunit [Candidatus Palauibacter soopunensis]|uniref:efflux RND transporter permease subunit n=1 Tax=Candidatus Palauibacter soopunensis TaxID=3056739 RepID=UPI0023A210FB|nr:efflux RND transporter permease subunit [Candidatus Palauibacter soopunensis]MDE2878900.1 efflux RND transporter permease subunit [Candidatus Palauibacter soopunensis]
MSDDGHFDRENIRGPIGFMAKNGIAANVVMLFLVLAGLASARNLVQEVLPDFSLDRVQIVVPYPGAAPEEVEESIVRRIEEQIRAVDGLNRVEATASEGLASVIAEFTSGTDVNRALNELKAEVDRIPTFPAAAERPEIREITSRQSVIRLLVYGDVPERTLKELAYDIEEGLSALPEVSLAEISGARPYEISIEVPLRRLRALGLTLDDIAFAVRQSSLELSAGRVSTSGEDILVRTLGQNYEQVDFEEIILLGRPDGTSVRLGEIATVRDGFADTDLSVRYNGQTAVRVDVYRTSEEQVLDIAEAVKRYLDVEVVPALPEGVSVELWKDDSEEVSGRLGLMTENALIGFALVFLALALFLEIRLAMWVAVGLAVSFMGAFLVMGFLGISINMFSLMALVLALGIVVDDAIVVGESIFAERERGQRGLAAAIRGTRRVSTPVIFSVLTTITAFAALLNAPGPQGELGRGIPLVVIAVLVISLMESLLVLPNHLSHLAAPGVRRSGAAQRMLHRAQGAVDRIMKRIADGPLDRGLRLATEQPSIILAAAAGLLVISLGAVASGIVPNQFITPIEGDVVSANLEMPTGTPAERTARIVGEIEAAGHRAVARLSEDGDGGEDPLEFDVAVTVGELAALYDPLGGDAVEAARGHLGTVQFKLHDWNSRGIAASTFERVWREEVGTPAEAKSLSISSNLLGLGLPVHYELSHPDPDRLEAIAGEFTAELTGMEGTFDVRSNLDEGFRELQLELNPAGRSLDLTLDRFATQVRSAFFGAEALRVPRGREDMRVWVRLPEEERNSATDVENYLVRTPGGEVPLGQIASAGFSRSSAAIHRVDGRRAVTITADVDPRIATGQQVNARLDNEVLPRLTSENPDLAYAYGGQRKEQDHAISVLGRSLILALLIMYSLMAIPFGSYTQPLIIMAAVPLGAIGALAGHMLLGLSWGLWSLYGLVGVFGVVVNDSLMMIRFINDLRDSGLEPSEAIISGAKERFRAIMLTSITTFLGVAPLVFETSTYAQHLVPLATSVGFGVFIATILLMVVVPALVMTQYNLEARRERWRLARA